MYFVVFALLLGFVLLAARRLHETTFVHKVLSEAALVLIVGIAAGAVAVQFLKDVVVVQANANGNEDDAVVNNEFLVVQSLLSFSPNVFFMALLPPILFWSGYQLRRELFYRHITPIVTFAAVGTTLSALSCAGLLWGFEQLSIFSFSPSLLELLAFGSLIAATDTVSVIAVLQAKKVDPRLFYVVFGESALNDAVALVLFESFADMIREQAQGHIGSISSTVFSFIWEFLLQAVGSPLLGIVSAWVVAHVIRRANLKSFPMLELSFYLLNVYLPYMLAECLHLSGIVTIFFAGISARRYIAPNLSETTRENGQVLFKLAAYLAEVCIFLELGLSVFGLNVTFDWGFIVCALVACLLARAISIYPLVFVYNMSLKERRELPIPEVDDSGSVSSTSTSGVRKRKTPEKRRDKKITPRMAHILWFSGLRGAVAYACVRDFPNYYGHADEFIASTMVIVLFTIIVMGGGLEFLLEFLGIEMNVDEEEYMKSWHKERELKGAFHDFGTSSTVQGAVCRCVAHTVLSRTQVHILDRGRPRRRRISRSIIGGTSDGASAVRRRAGVRLPSA